MKQANMKVKSSTLCRVSAILFFCNPLIKVCLSLVLPRFGLRNLVDFCTIIIVYAPFLIAALTNPKKYLKADVVILFLFVYLFFGITYLIHPNYEYWYFRPDYGVWPYVLKPTNAIYGYLFVRSYSDPDDFRRDFKIAGWAMYLYFFYQIVLFMRRGFWYGVAGTDSSEELSYSVSFGYNVLLYFLVFLYDAIQKKGKKDIIASIVGFVMMLTYGSRGPAMCLAIFFILLVAVNFAEMKNLSKKYFVFVAIAILLGIVYYLYIPLSRLLVQMLSSANISSRLIEKIVDGSITADSGRSRIWDAAVQMIKDNPWGYGAMGSQHVISDYIYVGYPHSIVLELLIDFGVFAGIIILGILLWNACSILFRKGKEDWRSTFLPFFCTASGLFISLCYWSNKAFWICVGLGVSAALNFKKKKRIAR